MPSIRVRGVPDPAAVRAHLADTVEGVRSGQAVRVEAGRADQQLTTLEGEFVELELTGGVRLWAPTDTIARDLGARPTRDGAPLELPTVFPLRQRGRSAAGDLAIQTISTFEIEIAGGIADFIENRVEKGREPGGQLLQCVTPSAAAFAPPARLAGGGPVLVFVHGTASSTDGSFGGLWEAAGANRILRIDNPGARVNALFAHYHGRVLAFEHRSLSESPITNALALVTQLAAIVPAGTELHLVSHSRGGLIGELLCRGMRRDGAPFDDLDVRLFEDAAADPDATREGRAKDRASLRELGRVLKAQRYRVARFVRVACPAAGTTLADGRLDRYASMLVNIAGRVTGLAGNPLYVALTNLLAAVLKERTRPESLPGLEAMMPRSPLVRMVNRRDVLSESPLLVLGGDIAISGFWSALKALATDFYYRDDHDLVVNTPSMLRGMPRATTVQYWIDSDGDVSHFNYFRRPETASRLTDLLTTGKASLRDLAVEPHDVDSDAYTKRDAAPRPVLFLIPGFMGSHLAVAGGRVWAASARLAQGGLALLAGKAAATPDGLVGAYTDLVRHLSATHEVVPFAYDWRLAPVTNADALRRAIDTRLAAASGDAASPIRVLTHGAGGLVWQALLASPAGAATWARACAHPGARAVLLGHPFGGTAHATLALQGEGPLVEGLAAIDLVDDAATIASVLGGFAGLQALTPARAPAAADYAVFDLTRTTFVAGTADATPVGFGVDDAGPIVETTLDGDGYSTWAAVPAAVRTAVCLAPEDHGGLVTADDVRPAIVELLTTGRTWRLAVLPSTAGRDAVVRTAPRPRLQQIPNDAELVGAGLGVGPLRRVVARPKVAVTVVHGNLSRADSPVVVGHYDQGGFANAEDYLDRQLGGRLRERHSMRLYPAAIGTSAVEVLPADVPSAAHPGAVVVGLGVVGELTPGSLLQTLEDGLTAFGAERVADRIRRRQARDLREAADAQEAPPDADTPIIPSPLTALLVGSGEAGLTLRDSLHALLRAVLGANARLEAPAAEARAARQLSVPAVARIVALDIVELYEDRAVEALRTLHELMSDAEFAEGLAITPTLQTGNEGRQRVSFEEQAAWWQRLRVTEQDASIDPEVTTGRRVLKFEAFGERARIDAYAVNSQRDLASAFVGDAMGTTAANQRIGRALFEMLVPNAIKERAPDRRDTVLLLDAHSAAIPWELLEDGLQRDRRTRRPMAIEAGLVRQLIDEHGRELVRRATGNDALVVGNPPVADPRFADLPGAEGEAALVAAQLARTYGVQALIGSATSPREILAALHERPWKVLHMALHGVFDFPAVAGGQERVTGAVVGRGVYLTPADFNQMRYVPDLVFLNCCHGGNTASDVHRPRYPQLAANLATQFIKMGARAVVAAGWAVNDEAAKAFAQVFYAQMIDGQPFGRATLAARDAIYRRFAHVNTWGAYQCYGDPDFSLRAPDRTVAARPPLCARELILAVDAITSQAKISDDRAIDGLRGGLDHLVRKAEAEGWLGLASVCAALGAAYGELREFGRATDYYQRARLAEKADLTVAALEQLASLKSRHAEHLWRDSADRRAVQKKIDALLDDADALLGQLVVLQPSGERLALLGGVAKRRAMTRPDAAARVAALSVMAERFRSAYELKVANGHGDHFYPFVNAAIARLALSWLRPQAVAAPAAKRKATAKRGTTAGPDLDADIARLLAFEAQQTSATDFWSLSFLAESALVRALHGGKSKDVTRSVLERYRRAQRRGRSRRELDSAITQIRFLSQMARAAPAKNVRELAGALDQLGRQLSEPQG